MTIKELMKESNATAIAKGWWEDERTFGDIIALMHSELSEALEEYRREGTRAYRMLWHSNGKPEGIAVEFADVLIRIFDTCQRLEIPLEEALAEKLSYNQTRPYKHGGKVI